ASGVPAPRAPRLRLCGGVAPHGFWYGLRRPWTGPSGVAVDPVVALQGVRGHVPRGHPLVPGDDPAVLGVAPARRLGRQVAVFGVPLLPARPLQVDEGVVQPEDRVVDGRAADHGAADPAVHAVVVAPGDAAA